MSIAWKRNWLQAWEWNPKIWQQFMRTYVENQFICAFELRSIYILQVGAYFIVSWNSSSFFSKKETKPQINFYTRQSLLTHLCQIRWLRDKIYEALKYRVERSMYLNWLWKNDKLTVGLRCQPFEVDASSVSNTVIPWRIIGSTE